MSTAKQLAACRLSDSPVEKLEVLENCKAPPQADDRALNSVFGIAAVITPQPLTRRPLARVAQATRSADRRAI